MEGDGHEACRQARNPALAGYSSGGGGVALTAILLTALIAIVLSRHRDTGDSNQTTAAASGIRPATSPAGDEPEPSPAPEQTLHEYRGQPQHRRETVRQEWPELTEAEARMLVDESDRIAAALEADGIDGSSLHLRHELKRIEISEQEARDYYDGHRESFGDRTFEESRASVERLVRHRRLRERYSADDEIVVLVDGFDDEP